MKGAPRRFAQDDKKRPLPAPPIVNVCSLNSHQIAGLLARIGCGLLLPLLITGCGASLSLGKGSAAIVAIPGKITFGSLQVGNTASAQVTLVNRSLSAAKVAGLNIAGKYFSIPNQVSLPLSVPAGGTYRFTVQFDPAETGSMTGELTVKGDSSTSDDSVVYLSGDGMKGAASSASVLTANSTAISFGPAVLNTVSTQTLTLTSSGTLPVTINSATTSGSGFTATGLALPATISPGQSAVLTVEFDPTSTGSSNGALVIASNSTGNSALSIPLTGTGVPMGVELNWNAPSSPDDPIAGFNVYRSAQGSSQFQLLNAAPDSQTDFTDSTVQTGQTYDYYVTSVDTSGTESAPSIIASVAIPNIGTQGSYRNRSAR